MRHFLLLGAMDSKSHGQFSGQHPGQRFVADDLMCPPRVSPFTGMGAAFGGTQKRFGSQRHEILVMLFHSNLLRSAEGRVSSHLLERRSGWLPDCPPHGPNRQH